MHILLKVVGWNFSFVIFEIWDILDKYSSLTSFLQTLLWSLNIFMFMFFLSKAQFQVFPWWEVVSKWNSGQLGSWWKLSLPTYGERQALSRHFPATFDIWHKFQFQFDPPAHFISAATSPQSDIWSKLSRVEKEAIWQMLWPAAPGGTDMVQIGILMALYNLYLIFRSALQMSCWGYTWEVFDIENLWIPCIGSPTFLFLSQSLHKF